MTMIFSPEGVNPLFEFEPVEADGATICVAKDDVIGIAIRKGEVIVTIREPSGTAPIVVSRGDEESAWLYYNNLKDLWGQYLSWKVKQ